MKIIDGLQNFVSRLGTRADKAAHDTYAFVVPNQVEIDNAFRTTWLKKIVTIPAEDAVREGWTWQANTDDETTLIEAEQNRLNIAQCICEALTLSRKDGSAFLYMGGLPGDASMPLNIEAVRAGSLKYLTLFERWQCSPSEREQDPISQNYGGAKYYTVGQARIHPSRIIRFIGNKVYGQQWDGHGDSIWTVIREGVKNADLIAAATASLTHEAKTDVYKLAGFGANIPTQAYEDVMVKRFQLVASLKSIVNATVMDKEDEWEQKTINFAGLPDIQDRALLIMCGLADIPATRLLGKSPQGLQSSGDGELKNYYDNVAARQKLVIGPAIHPLMEVLIRSALGSRPPEIHWNWNPLWQMSAKESADIEKVFADAFVARIGTGAIDEAVLAKAELNGMVERGQLPGLEAAIAESKEDDGVKDPDEVEAKEIERMNTEAEIAANAAVKRPVAANDKDVDA